MNFMFGFHDHICKLLYNYLTNRKFKVKINKTTSNTFSIDAGVPQGSILAAILFITYLSDFPLPSDTPKLNKKMQSILYADDIIIYFPTRIYTRTQKNN